MSDWISMKDKRPSYFFVPVLICVAGVVQEITYYIDGDEERSKSTRHLYFASDWLAPYLIEKDEYLEKIPIDKVSHWMPLPESPDDKP